MTSRSILGRALVPALLAAMLGEGAGALAAPRLDPVGFEALPGWTDDRMAEALVPLLNSCRQLMSGAPTDPDIRPAHGGTRADWASACAGLEALAAAGPVGDAALRRYLEGAFRAWAVSDGGDDRGLFTGYFEVELSGSLTREHDGQVPLYLPPAQDALRRQTRGEIAAGGLAGQGLELVWLDSAIDAFFLDIQGSGLIRLRDGSARRVRYVRFNGHGYRPVGRRLIEMGEVAREEMSMQAITAWMRANPDRTQELMNYNRSYVYFDWLEKSAAQGSQGTDLTPGRSLAIDPRTIPYGAPLWLDTTHPETGAPLRRLMLAQDKGGAIKGVVRGDFFWGTGPDAAAPAGRMKSSGRYFLLLPAGFDPRTDG